jgi:hypothetical protein
METGAIEEYSDFRRYLSDMEGIRGMKSDVQSALENVFEEDREMGVGVKEEGIVIEGEIPNPMALMPVYDLLQDLERVTVREAGTQVPTGTVAASVGAAD